VPWLAVLIAAGNPTTVTPVDAVTSTIVGYIAGFGVLGYLVLALVFRWLVPGRTAEKDRQQARADLERENARLLEDHKRAEERWTAERAKLEEQRDEAAGIAVDRIVPLLSSFNDTARGLIPLLQEVVRNQESGGGTSARRSR
jgi:hypothetical protein